MAQAQSDNPTASSHYLYGLIDSAALLLILLLAAYLRLHNVAENPGWYTDEATQINIAQNLMHGRVQYMAVQDSTLMFARLPLFPLTLSQAFELFGVSMGTLRGLTGSLGVLTVGLLYGVLRIIDPKERWLPLAAALILALHPLAVLYSRFGFSYAMLAPLVLLVLLGLTCYWQTGKRHWLALATGAMGLGLISDLLMGSFLLPVLAVTVLRRPRDLLLALPLIAAPFGLYALIACLINFDAFFSDLFFTLGRLNVYTLPEQIDVVIENYTILLKNDIWFPLGVFGLFTLRPPRLKIMAALLFWVPFIMLSRTTAMFHLSYYYNIPLLPLVALGIAGLIRYGVGSIQEMAQSLPAVWQKTTITAITLGTVVIVLGIPLIASLEETLGQVNTGYKTAIDPFLLDPAATQEVAAFINAQTQPDDLVIASPGIVWLLEANAVDFQMSVAISDNIETVHLAANIGPERLAFDPDYRKARFVVVDEIWRGWGRAHIPGADIVLDAVDDWPLVLEAGPLSVYQNPGP